MRFTAFLVSLLTISQAVQAHPGSGVAHDLSHTMAGHPGTAHDILAMIAVGAVIVGAVFALRWAVSRKRPSQDR